MTIAARFRCRDGVVLCADTQETIPDYLKTSAPKLDSFQHDHNYRLALTGAGESDMIDMVFQQLMRRLMVDQHDYEFIERTIRDVIGETVREHVHPAPKEDRPWFHLLIAVQVKGQRVRLLKTTGTVVRQVVGFACVGGVAFAHDAVAGFDVGEMPMCVVRGLAIHVLQRVKHYDPNCGKRTQVTMLYDDWDVAYLSQRYIQEVEIYLSDIDVCLRDILQHSLAHRGTDSGMTEALEHLKKHAEEFQRIERERSDERCKLRDEFLVHPDTMIIPKKSDVASPDGDTESRK